MEGKTYPGTTLILNFLKGLISVQERPILIEGKYLVMKFSKEWRYFKFSQAIVELIPSGVKIIVPTMENSSAFFDKICFNKEIKRISI